MFQVLPVPVAVVALFLLIGAWHVAVQGPPSRPVLDGAVRAMIPLLIALVPVHELVHALAHPFSGRSPFTILGFWPKALLFFAHYTGEMSRNRLLASLLAPFMVLTVVPLVLTLLTGWWHWAAVELSILNALLGAGDLTSVLIVTSQVPTSATVRNKGYYTWWKPDTQPA